MSDRPAILITRRGGRWHVSAVPDPGDGSRCADTFTDHQAAAHFASQLRRARGWPIITPTDPRQARQAHGE